MTFKALLLRRSFGLRLDTVLQGIRLAHSLRLIGFRCLLYSVTIRFRFFLHFCVVLLLTNLNFFSLQIDFTFLTYQLNLHLLFNNGLLRACFLNMVSLVGFRLRCILIPFKSSHLKLVFLRSFGNVRIP
ncbi:hypothetical protein D3C76_1373830 [compost metagenome]